MMWSQSPQQSKRLYSQRERGWLEDCTGRRCQGNIIDIINSSNSNNNSILTHQTDLHLAETRFRECATTNGADAKWCTRYWISRHPGMRPNAYTIQFWRQAHAHAHGGGTWMAGTVNVKDSQNMPPTELPPTSLIAKAQWDTCRWRWHNPNPTKMEMTHYLPTTLIVLLHHQYIYIYSKLIYV